MSINLSARQRARFRSDLLSHRETFTLNDADYADQVLKVSLNTYKKCIQPAANGPLALKRQTWLGIFANTPLDPKTYGLAVGVPTCDSPFGGYSVEDFRHLCARFHIYRRSFLTARQITCGVLEIRPSDVHDCLAFSEIHSYVSEAATRQELRYSGDVYMNPERSLLSLPSYADGQVRLTMLSAERVGGRSRVKMRGAQLTYGNPKGFWQPTVSCIYVDGPVDERRTSLRDLCRTIDEGTPEHDAISAELSHVEDYATIITPLMWARHRMPAPAK